jgi:hypothetical protein
MPHVTIALQQSSEGLVTDCWNRDGVLGAVRAFSSVVDEVEQLVSLALWIVPAARSWFSFALAERTSLK